MRRRWARWISAGVTILLLMLYALNMPFYSGAGITARLHWRMEHGRLTVERTVAHRESFYIAINSEGLRFRPRWRYGSWDAWSVTIPLWAPLGLAAGWCAWVWWPRRLPHACRACGYSRAGLAQGAPCPECGTRPRAPRGAA